MTDTFLAEVMADDEIFNAASVAPEGMIRLYWRWPDGQEDCPPALDPSDAQRREAEFRALFSDNRFGPAAIWVEAAELRPDPEPLPSPAERLAALKKESLHLLDMLQPPPSETTAAAPDPAPPPAGEPVAATPRKAQLPPAPAPTPSTRPLLLGVPSISTMAFVACLGMAAITVAIIEKFLSAPAYIGAAGLLATGVAIAMLVLCLIASGAGRYNEVGYTVPRREWRGNDYSGYQSCTASRDANITGGCSQ